jgi:hypothetical protein
VTQPLARTFTLAIDEERILVSRAMLRWLRDQLETIRQAIASRPTPTDEHKRAAELRIAASRAVTIMIEEELENRHPHAITLAGLEAEAVYLVAHVHVEARDELLAELQRDRDTPLLTPDEHHAAIDDLDTLDSTLEHHLRRVGLLD